MSSKKYETPHFIETKQQLIQYFADGCKNASEFKIGTENESFLYYKNNNRRVSYKGKGGIQNILDKYVDNFGWEPIYEKENIVSLKKGFSCITLEPAGQIELSGAPQKNLHSTYEEVRKYFQQLRDLEKELNIKYLALGVDPFTIYEDRPWVEKERYIIMREYMPQKEKLGLEMMTATATIQSNLDFSSEQDMVCKLRLGLSLQPIITALFASSPFSQGKLNGFQSYRSYIWQHTDPDRCGWLPWAFEGEMSFEKYVDYLLGVPMYFIQSPGNEKKMKILPANGQTFGSFLSKGAIKNPLIRPTIKDWENHVGCVFPEVRLKKFLEMRGADAGPISHITALSALWAGLIYDPENLKDLSFMTKEWTNEDRHYLYKTVPRQGLATKFRGITLQILSKELLKRAAKGLKRRNNLNSSGQDESIYLEPLFAYAQEGENLALKMIDLYKKQWLGNLDSVFNF